MFLRTEKLSKHFKGVNRSLTIEVFDDLSFEVAKGQFISLVGPSGCGKTTLLRIISGLEQPTKGKVFLDGKQVSGTSPTVGLVFQEYALLPWRTTLGNIELGLEIKGIPKEDRRQKAMEYVVSFELSGFEYSFPKELSGGMQQRAAIARTLIMEPQVVLMDEPFGSLDSQTRNHMQEFLLRVWKKRKDTIIFVTHNIDEAVYLSDRVMILSKRPARLIDNYIISIERPRDRTSKECNKIRRQLLSIINK